MLEFALLAFGLGVKHSFDADHLVAVSNLLTRAKSIRHAAKMSAFWASGHMLTAAIITLLLIAFKDSLLPLVLEEFELAVAAMLIFLGAVSVAQAVAFHSHRHAHGGEEHEHFHMHLGAEKDDHSHCHMFGIGIVHGLASNDELLLLLTVSLGAATAAEMLVGVGIFSLGVVVGMIAFAAAFTLLRSRAAAFARALNFAVGASSIAYGIFIGMELLFHV